MSALRVAAARAERTCAMRREMGLAVAPTQRTSACAVVGMLGRLSEHRPQMFEGPDRNEASVYTRDPTVSHAPLRAKPP